MVPTPPTYSSWSRPHYQHSSCGRLHHDGAVHHKELHRGHRREDPQLAHIAGCSLAADWSCVWARTHRRAEEAPYLYQCSKSIRLHVIDAPSRLRELVAILQFPWFTSVCTYIQVIV